MSSHQITKKQDYKASGLKIMKLVITKTYLFCWMLGAFTTSLLLGGQEAYRSFNEKRLEQRTKVQPWGYFN